MIEFNINFNKAKKDFIKYLYANADKEFKSLCNDTLGPLNSFLNFTNSLKIDDIKSYLDKDRIDILNEIDILKNPDDWYDIIDVFNTALTTDFMKTNNAKYIRIINEFISLKTKIFTYDAYGDMLPTPYTKALLGKCYHFIRKYIRSKLEQKESIHTVDCIKEALQHCPII